MNLKEFNDIYSGSILEIELSKKRKKISKNLLNEKAPPDALIKNLTLVPIELPSKEVVLKCKTLKIRGRSGEIIEHKCNHFTAADLIKAIEKTECLTRSDTEWFGGIDVHHIYFEGLHKDPSNPDVYDVYWGS